MAVQLPLPVLQQEAPSFDNFLDGGNAEAVAALRAGDQNLQLCGPRGCGKSHLLRARARQQAGGLYLPTASLDATTLARLLDGAADCPWLGVDDLESLCSDSEASRHAAVSLLRVLDIRARRQLPSAIAASRPAARLTGLLRDLQTRLGRFAIWWMQPLDDAVLQQWLEGSARRRGLELADGASDWLLQRLPRNPASLDQALQSLDTAALAAKRRRITLPFMRSVLGLR